MKDHHPLPDFLAAFVPLRIAELKAAGGPSERDWARMRAFGPELAAKGDQILYRGKEMAHLAEELLFAVAVLAFVPGGVKLFGERWEAEPEEGEA